MEKAGAGGQAGASSAPQVPGVCESVMKRSRQPEETSGQVLEHYPIRTMAVVTACESPSPEAQMSGWKPGEVMFREGNAFSLQLSARLKTGCPALNTAKDQNQQQSTESHQYETLMTSVTATQS